MKFVRPFLHIRQSHAAVPVPFPHFSAVILNAELIQRRMFPDGNRCFAGIAVPHDIGECLFCNADKAVFDIPGDHSSGIVAICDRTESKIIDQ